MAGHRARQVAIVSVIVATTVGIGGQEPAPLFRSEINFVQVPVRVLDAHGEFVRGLTQSDFQIFEDGESQTISAFSVIDIPFTRTENALPGGQPEARADRRADSAESPQADRRIYVLVLDNRRMGAATALRTRHVMRGFISDHLAVNDAAAIVFSGSGRGQPLTQDRRLLDAALDRLNSDDDSPDMGSHRLSTFIAETARSMGAIPGRRKALVLVTASTLCSIDNGECRESLNYALRASIQSDVSVYAIDSRGLNAYERTRAEHANPNSTYGAGGYTELNSRDAARAAFGATWSEFHGALSGTRYLAEESGGFAVVNTNSLAEGFARMVREHSAYYMLGYYSTNTRADGKVRRNRVSISRTGLHVAHRSGYLAPRPTP